eukprot:8885572-Pyramimonas_sp.AAC.1
MLLGSGSPSQFCRGVRTQIPTGTLGSQSPPPPLDAVAQDRGASAQDPSAASPSHAPGDGESS